MPSKVDGPRPSCRERAKAASRFGPAVPVALARASVWQAAQFSTNFCLPLARLGSALLSWQPLSATAPAAAPPKTARPLLMRGILTGGGDGRAAPRLIVMRAPFLVVAAAWLAMMAATNLATPLYA